MDLDTDSFSDLHYHPKNSIPQCEKLIMQAHIDNRCTPLYCLYLSAGEALAAKYNSADLCRHGCSVLSAYEVRQFRSTNEDRLDQLWHLLKPWHRLVCPENGVGFIDHINQFANSYFVSERQRNEQLWTNEPPPYVLELSETGDVKASLNEKQLDLAGVLVIGSRSWKGE